MSSHQESAERSDPRVLSPYWHRVSHLVVGLRPHLEFARHRYRGRTWFVLSDPAGDRFHRYEPQVHELLQQLDGSRTLDEVWSWANEAMGDAAPTQEEFLLLLSQLHSADALAGTQAPDLQELLRRSAAPDKNKRLGALLSPVSWQVTLLDPERFLQRTLPWVRKLFGPLGLLLWINVVLIGLVLGIANYEELSHDLLDRVLSMQNLALLWALYPALKVLHEFGHAYVAKHYGAEVHKMGVLFIVLMPLPFVDASGSAAFPHKYQRIAVGFAGMAVELFVAGVAMIVWVLVEPGALRAIAYNTVLIAGVSTVLFNGNPLLRYDGYYILSDLIEIPNLRQRSNRHWMTSLEAWLSGLSSLRPPPATASERRWFWGYGLASFLYRMTVLVSILMLILSRFFFVGVVLAAWSLLTWIVLPLAQGAYHLARSPRLRTARFRALARAGIASGALALLLFGLPMPRNTIAEGVLWPPEGALVRVAADGFVSEVLCKNGELVSAGSPLLRGEDPELESRLAESRGRIEELRAQHQALERESRVAAAQVSDQLEQAEEELRLLEEREEELVLRAPFDGRLAFDSPHELTGSFLRRGDVVARVLDPARVTIRVVLEQDSVDALAEGVRRTRVRLVQRPDEIYEASIERRVPQGRRFLPSSALGRLGGGQVVVTPDGAQTLVSHFEYQLGFVQPPLLEQVGGRVHARFEHPWEPYGPRVLRHVRRLFLSRFDI